MKPQDFQSSEAGLPRKTLEGYWAFLPKPLPPSIKYSADFALLLSNADAALGELSGIARYLPNPDLFIAPYIKREAVASSKIEGTQADLSDLLLDEIEPKRTPPGSDVMEVRNYVAALNFGLEQIRTLPLSGRLVRNLHAVLMKDVRGQEMTPGEFRRSQNWIGPPGCGLNDATYVPPPHDPEMKDCLAEWERFMNRRNMMPDLLQCALIHEHFEAIHPFLDGNGRIGRLLITLFLVERGRLSTPLLYLSSYIERHRAQYYAELQRIRTHGDWSGWFKYFLVAVRDTARDAIAQSHAIIELRTAFRLKIGKDPKALMLLDELFINPYTTVAKAAQVLGVTSPTAGKAIGVLVKAGMLKEITGREWGRFWVSDPIFHALEATPTQQPSESQDKQSPK